MAYDLYLEERIKEILNHKKIACEAKKMMGGLCFMVNDKMCVGIIKNMLMARIDPTIYEECLLKEGCKPMTFTGRSSKGFVFVEPEAIDTYNDLEHWIQLCLDFNPKAKSSRKNK